MIVPVIALLPDFTMMFVLRVFYRSPADVAMLKYKDELRKRSLISKDQKAKPAPYNGDFNDSTHDIEKVPLKNSLNDTTIHKNHSNSKSKSHSLRITAPNDKNSFN